jgi:hypothetical protein
MTATKGAIASVQLTRALLDMAARSERHKHRVRYQGASQRRLMYEP